MPIFNLKEIMELMDRVASSGLGLLEIESSGMRLRIEGRKSESQPQPRNEAPARATQIPAPTAPQDSAFPPAGDVAEESEDSWHIVTSPIVGTFYRAPNPETDSFVEVGDRVAKGRILCIIEAMKLMNEIESDSEGVVVKVYPQNGQPVEFGEKLFALKAD